MSPRSDVAAVVVAGGRGTRFGAEKQFVTLGVETVAARSVRLARSVASRVVLVVPQGYQGNCEGADDVVVGGSSRAASVRAGLSAVDATYVVVVVHDAARPLASPELFDAVVNALSVGVDAAIPGLEVTDTVKRVTRRDARTVVSATLARDDLVTVQTPQAFRRSALVRAHGPGYDATDDATLVEAWGGTVVVVPGDINNIKITEPADLRRVAMTLRATP